MSFLLTQKQASQKSYFDYLKIAGALSNLFSENEIPYLYYRIAEKVFCRAFGAEDLSRSDVSADAKKEGIGIGLKTFLANNHKTFQKIAEFNNDRSLYQTLSTEKKIKKIAELRNLRIEFTENNHNLKKSLYHCVLREKGKFLIFEEPMDYVDITNIKNVKEKKGSIIFNDGKNDYAFNKSKSTLFKRFITKPSIYEIDVQILKDPIRDLQKLFAEGKLVFEEGVKIQGTVYLPLYGKDQTVFEKSGLNQWNAGGRERHPNEVYIPVPALIHKNFPGFFPDRDTPFSLKLPNEKIMKSKICQEGGKALMSYSNKELGQWILRDILKLKEGEILTYSKLQALGIDTVRIDKINSIEFEINFSKLGRYEVFQTKMLNG